MKKLSYLTFSLIMFLLTATRLIIDISTQSAQKAWDIESWVILVVLAIGLISVVAYDLGKRAR